MKRTHCSLFAQNAIVSAETVLLIPLIADGEELSDKM